LIAGIGQVRELDRQSVQLFLHKMDLVLRLSALRRVQLHRHARETTIGPPRYRSHHLKITQQFLHRGQRRGFLALPLRLQEQLRLIQKPCANRRCGSAPGRIQLTRFTAAQTMPR
jgi:hypothetical protein